MIANGLRHEEPTGGTCGLPVGTPILELVGVCKSFGGVQAVYDLSFAVQTGQIVALIGPNGAGKTTAFNVISAVLPPDAGTVLFQGEAIRASAPHKVAVRGIARTFQNVQLFADMSALENVAVGRHGRTRAGLFSVALRLPWARREERQILESARSYLEWVGLAARFDHAAADLPFGQQRLLEIARALATEPKLLLLDEPAAGLNPVETEQVAELIYRIRDAGTTVLLVEHDMDLVMDIADRVVVLDRGRKIAEGSPDEVQNDERVIAAYLGEDWAEAQQITEASVG